MVAPDEYKFEGWMGLDAKAAEGNMVWQEFPDVKPFDETDVDIQITHFGKLKVYVDPLDASC